MKDFIFDHLPVKNKKQNKTRPKTKNFGYQVLGFGSGGGGEKFIVATGGTETTSGDYKIHTNPNLSLIHI